MDQYTAISIVAGLAIGLLILALIEGDISPWPSLAIIFIVLI